MKKEPTESASEILGRRTFLRGGVAALAGAMLFGRPALGALLDIQFEEPTETPTPEVGADKIQVSKVRRQEFELAKPFIGEKYIFDVRFLGAKTATGLVDFKQTGTNQYTASVEASTTGVVGAVTQYRKVSMTSVMEVERVDGKERFVTQIFYRRTIKTDGEQYHKHELDYRRRRWTVTRYKNGVKTRTRRRQIPPGKYYDDFVAILYNFRAQVYAPVAPGLDMTITTLPMSRTMKVDGKKVRKESDTVRVLVPKPESWTDEEKKWIERAKADYMVLVKVDKDVYGIPSGEARMAGTNKHEPRSAWGQDIILFGDVMALRTN